MGIKFETIHKISIDMLSRQNRNTDSFEVIGNWYFNFLCSSEETLTLKLPHCDSKSLNDIYQYLRNFLFVFTMNSKPRLTDFNDTCLFNILGYKQKNIRFNKSDFSIKFSREEKNLLVWGKDILISKNVFLPVFKLSPNEKPDWDVINNAFKIFKEIRLNKLIEYPILIDLEKDTFLSISCSNDLTPEECLLFHTLVYKKGNDDDDIDLEEELINRKISNQISITYPYNRNIRSWFLEIAEKKFQLDLYDRFYYNEISKDDIFLLPDEMVSNSNVTNNVFPNFKIFDTNHEQGLYELMTGLKEEWQRYGFNKFTTPFPKYWLLFINRSLSKEDWVAQFEVNYPNVAEKPIIRDIEKVISKLHDLNWAESFVNKLVNPVFLTPTMKGLKAKKLKSAFFSFKNFLLTINPKVEFVEANDDYNYSNYQDLVILEAFNIIDIVNIFQNNKSTNYIIVVPDFIYFSYQPWIKYVLANYQFDALLSSKREKIDRNYNSNISVWQGSKIKIIEDIKLDIKEYKKKYNLILIDDEPKEIALENEDFELKNYEEIEQINIKLRRPNKCQFVIISSKGYQLRLSFNNKVLIQRNTVITGKAFDLRPGDCFISLDELNSAIDVDGLVDRLSDVPQPVKYFQVKLNAIKNVYHILESRGLNYRSEKYFTNKYVISADHFNEKLFMIPRKRKHWELICDLLNIDNNDMAQTWIAHYGRKNINELKIMYRYILDLFLNKNYFGETDNPSLRKEVTDYIQAKENIFDYGEEFDSNEIAESMISSIINILEFHEIIQIKTI